MQTDSVLHIDLGILSPFAEDAFNLDAKIRLSTDHDEAHLWSNAFAVLVFETGASRSQVYLTPKVLRAIAAGMVQAADLIEARAGLISAPAAPAATVDAAAEAAERDGEYAL